jgi:hypothetical protein
VNKLKQDLELSKLFLLIKRLEATKPISQEELKTLRNDRSFFLKGKSSISQDDFFAYLKTIKDDIDAQCQITNRFFDAHFYSGEQVPPAYPLRIAIILSKAKKKELELRFLNAWCKHYPKDTAVGTVYNKLIIRREKLAERFAR